MRKVFSAVCVVLVIWGGVLSMPVQAAVREPACAVYFSPEDGLAEKLIERIHAEKQSICAAVYCLMHAGIAKALNEAKERGVDVEVIVDRYSIKARSPVAKMVEKGVPVYVWNPADNPAQSGKKGARRKSLMHDKFCIFGNHTVWTGSFNFTREASIANRENAVVLADRAIAESFLKEFQAIKEGGCCPYGEFVK